MQPSDAGRRTGWRAVVCPPATGVSNMALDAALLADALARGGAWLRLYAFQRRTVTLGRGERAGDVLDLTACAADGIGVARRPTGGRAVLHDDELTYCVAIADGAEGVGADREAVARFTGELLAAALRGVGVPAETVRSSVAAGVDVAGGGAGRARPAYRSCFASASRWEVAVDGRKIVGSAQRRVWGGVLQHGSILLGPGFRALSRYLRGGSDAELLRATCASEATGRRVTRDEVARAVRHAVAERVRDLEVLPALPENVVALAEETVDTGDADPVWSATAAVSPR